MERLATGTPNNTVKCERCGQEIQTDQYMTHLLQEHGFTIFDQMKLQARVRGLIWTGLVFSIGVLLGILIRGLL